MNRSIFVVIILSTIISGFDCKKNPVAPPLQNGIDTTSHNWTFTIDTLGDGNGSTLNDAAIISTNPPIIYAVGNIQLKDSTGDYNPWIYNLLKWNGNKWELNHITVLFRGNNITPPLKGIFPSSQYQIWLVGGLAIYGDGQSWLPFDVRSITGFDSLSFTKCWGNNAEDTWFAGLNGSLTHMTQESWLRIPSGVTDDIQDVWGYKNKSTGQTTVLAISSTVFYGGTENLISVSGNNATKINTNGLSWSIRGLWFDDNGYYIVGDGMYYKKSLQDTVWQSFQKGITTNYINAIRGNAWNDIIAVGDFGTVLHYNGSSWYNYTQQINLPNCALYSVSIKDNYMVAVGTLGGDRAIAVVGVRK
jgi:hypothetical protein